MYRLWFRLDLQTRTHHVARRIADRLVTALGVPAVQMSVTVSRTPYYTRSPYIVSQSNIAFAVEFDAENGVAAALLTEDLVCRFGTWCQLSGSIRDGTLSGEISTTRSKNREMRSNGVNAASFHLEDVVPARQSPDESDDWDEPDVDGGTGPSIDVPPIAPLISGTLPPAIDNRAAYRLRAATAKDFPFLKRLGLSNALERADWFGEWQVIAGLVDRNHTIWLDPRCQIVLLDDRPVGTLYVDSDPVCTEIVAIAILPSQQRRGIGSTVIADIVAGSLQVGRPVTCWTHPKNPVRGLLERLGFVVERDHGSHVTYRYG